MTTKTKVIAYNVSAPSAAPAWFASMSSGTWATIAGGAGQRVVDKLPSPIPTTGLSGENSTSICTAWTGGCVDQSRREYILCANGGHADYPGNEAYGLSLGDSAPAWRRLSDPSPNSQMTGHTPTVDPGPFINGAACNADGRPRAAHTTFEVFGDGKVWSPCQNAFTSAQGGFAGAVVSYDRNSLGAASSPLAWTSSNIGPWAIHGPISGANGSVDRFGRGLFDRVNHMVYGLGGFAANTTSMWRFPSQGASIGQAQRITLNQSVGNFNGWAVMCHDLGIIVAGDSLRQQICVLPVANWGSPMQIVSNVTGSGYFSQDEFGGAGGVYIQANHTIAVGDPKYLGRTIYKLQIPVTGSAYNSSGQWVWSQLNPTGATPSVASGNSSTNSKWNIVEDMGNGQSAIVFLGDISGPTYVYKVPPAGL